MEGDHPGPDTTQAVAGATGAVAAEAMEAEEAVAAAMEVILLSPSPLPSTSNITLSSSCLTAYCPAMLSLLWTRLQ